MSALKNPNILSSVRGEWPHILLETANFHGGQKFKLLQAIQTYSHLNYRNLGIKFHAFDPKLVSLPEFPIHEDTQKFLLAKDDWAEVIHEANKRKFSIWLDLFCVYGIEILRNNISSIFGIKLQPSVLDNLEVWQELQASPVNNLELILNIAGLETGDVREVVAKFSLLPFKKIILQMGFQNFPTSTADSSLEKVEKIRSHFPDFPLSYADHLDGGSAMGIRFPVYCYLLGCSYLEKHICLQREDTEYDFQSALEYSELELMVAELKEVKGSLSAGFLTDNERNYLHMTYQKPVLGKPLSKGQLIAESDLKFRRTEKHGIKLKDWRAIQHNYSVLKKHMQKWDTLSIDNFKRAKMAVLVAARMKSKRLPKKAIIPIGGIPSIRRCLQNCLKFPEMDEVILATSTEPEDSPLADYAGAENVLFWQGDPVDVLARYLGACREFGIDIVIRVTGDSPVVSPEIAGFLLNSHFASGADFTRPRSFAIGTNCEIYTTEALERISLIKGRTEYSEHLSLYVINNPEIFKVNYVDLPGEWIRNYRLTLDYPEDVQMFQALFSALEEEHLEPTLSHIFKILDKNPTISNINSLKTLVYETDSDLRKELDRKTRMDQSEIERWLELKKEWDQ